MNNRLLHTPEGVRDIYNLECARKETVEEQICSELKLFGYRKIQTPTFEFFDIFDKKKGSVDSREMYKFFDREGNTLVLRPDITPSIARAASKYFMDENIPIRIFYSGNTFINNSSYQGRLKETTQIGAELIGDGTSDADAEMIALLIQCLQKAGLSDFQIEVGQIDFFNGLMEESRLDEEEQDYLRELIENKNFFGVEELLSAKDFPKDLKDILLKLPEFSGSMEYLKEARKMTHNQTAIGAIDKLIDLYQILSYYGVENYISFDLGMLGKYKYYTGIIFKAYTYGTGDAIATGGRYDNLLPQFGKDSASIGFAIILDSLMTAMERQKICIQTDLISTILLYDRKQKQLAVQLANHLRSTGCSLHLMKKYHEKSIFDYIAYARRSFIGGILFIDELGQTVQVIEAESGERKIVRLTDFIKGDED